MSLSLAANYQQLEHLDRELSRAQQELLAAHRQLAEGTGPRPEMLYAQVLDLRARSRQLLDRLGEQLAGSL